MFWSRRVYADAAAATPLSKRSKAELERLLGVFGNPGALHREAVLAKRELEAARKRIATAIGAHADEILFTASGTEANNLALQGVLRPLLMDTIGGADGAHQHTRVHAITIAIEHQSILEPLRALSREGLEVTELGVDPEGLIIPNAVIDALRPNTALISVQLVNNEVGTIEPLRDIVRDLRRAHRKVLVHTDGSQAPLWVDINVQRLGVDLMTLDAQKVLGPKGVGCLYVRRGTPIESVLWGGKQERGLRGGTENAPQAGAFAVALDDAVRDTARRAARTAAVRDYLWSAIKKVEPDTILNGPLFGAARVANNLNVSIPGLEAEMAVVSMDALGVAVSTRSACTIGSDEPSHVIKALGVPKDLAGTAIRITLLPTVTKRDAKKIAAALHETAQRYRKP